ncbi:hypothetical protein Agub_g15604, partial [Astrephomene gubernaculifera]
MLWIAAAGIVALEARRRARQRVRAGLPSVGTFSEEALRCPVFSGQTAIRRVSSAHDSRTLDELTQLKEILVCLAPTHVDDFIGSETVRSALFRVEDALPWLVRILQTCEDSRALIEAAEILAQLSPSRLSLQPAICKAGAVQSLLRLLASVRHSPPPQQHGVQQQQKQQSRCFIDGNCAQQDYAEADRVVPLSASVVSAPALAAALRTLVNLTSDPRVNRDAGGGMGAPTVAAAVRQAVLQDEAAMEGLLQLLLLQPYEKEARDVEGGGGVSDVEWQLASLAAWLVAHLASKPYGQQMLVREYGIVPVLVRLVQNGRLACEEAAAAAAAAQRVVSSRTTTGSVLPTASVLPYFYRLSAVQYGLMALVNLTYEDAGAQWAVAAAGALRELELLLRPMGHADGECCDGGGGCFDDGSGDGGGMQGPQQQQADKCDGPPPPPQQQQQLWRYGNASGTGGGGGCGGGGAATGVLRLSVWLLAHLSSCDSRVKAAILDPSHGFLPVLVTLLTAAPHPQPQLESCQQHRRQQHQQYHQQQHGGDQQLMEQQQQHHHQLTQQHEKGLVVVRQQQEEEEEAITAVQQYAAMALVNLTCGAASAKVAVAAAADWGRVAELLHRLATDCGCSDGYGRGNSSGNGSVSAVTGTGRGAGSELLLYIVWLLQHLSLSPLAASLIDPRVVPPLVALLAAPDPHVRLRATAALGALASVSNPNPNPAPPTSVTSSFTSSAACTTAAVTASSSTATAVQHCRSTATASSATAVQDLGEERQQGKVKEKEELRPVSHRAAFLEADGIRRLLAAAAAERDPQVLVYGMLTLSSVVGENDVASAVEAVAGGALGILEGVLVAATGATGPAGHSCYGPGGQAACLIAAAEALEALARAALTGCKRRFTARDTAPVEASSSSSSS